jgi:hypothetical protein
MKEIVRCREMASLCRQRSAFYHDEKWAWLAKASMWDGLADQYLEQHYRIEEDVKIAPDDGPGEVVELTAVAAASVAW